MQILALLAHPRRDSLTGHCFDRLTQGLTAQGHGVEIADLYREGFDPNLPPEDEPTWTEDRQRFTAETEREIERLLRAEALLLVFPIWWWSFPAILKGWIDRVWNYNVAYGEQDLSGKKGFMLGLAANSQEGYAKRGYEEAMRTCLEVGVFEYCGIAEGRLEILYDCLDGEAEAGAALERAKVLGDTLWR